MVILWSKRFQLGYTQRILGNGGHAVLRDFFICYPLVRDLVLTLAGKLEVYSINNVATLYVRI